MKNLLKNKKVLVGLVVIAGAVGYYYYDKKKKAQIKADAEVLANTPVYEPVYTTEPAPVQPPTTQEIQQLQREKSLKLNTLEGRINKMRSKDL